MIETSSDVRAWAATGKPSDILRDVLVDLIGSMENSVFIGDEFSTDREQARIMSIPEIIVSKRGYDVTRKDYAIDVLFVRNLLEVL